MVTHGHLSAVDSPAGLLPKSIEWGPPRQCVLPNSFSLGVRRVQSEWPTCSSSHAAFRRACTQLRCQKGVRQNGTFFPTAARAGPKIHGLLLRCLQNKRPLPGERELWLRPGQAGGVTMKFRERPAPPSPPSPMLKGMEWIGSCKINAHSSGGEETELVQHCALGGTEGAGCSWWKKSKLPLLHSDRQWAPEGMGVYFASTGTCALPEHAPPVVAESRPRPSFSERAGSLGLPRPAACKPF